MLLVACHELGVSLMICFMEAFVIIRYLVHCICDIERFWLFFIGYGRVP